MNPEVIFVDIDPQLAERFMSVLRHNPDVGVSLSALVTDAVKFVLGEQGQLDMEASGQHFIQDVQEQRIPCPECRGYSVYYDCTDCGTRGWVWAKNGVEK